MPVSKNKTQIGISVPKELKYELEKIAKYQDRSLSNLLTIVLKEYVNSNKLPDGLPDSENLPNHTH